MFNNKQRLITIDEIIEAWDNKMICSHNIPKISKRCKLKNKYEQTKLHAKKLIKMFLFL